MPDRGPLEAESLEVFSFPAGPGEGLCEIAYERLMADGYRVSTETPLEAGGDFEITICQEASTDPLAYGLPFRPPSPLCSPSWKPATPLVERRPRLNGRFAMSHDCDEALEDLIDRVQARVMELMQESVAEVRQRGEPLDPDRIAEDATRGVYEEFKAELEEHPGESGALTPQSAIGALR